MKRCLLIVLSLLSFQSFSQTLETDRLALVAVFNSMGGKDWFSQIREPAYKWIIPGKPGDSPCGWNGVLCGTVDGQQRVISLDIGEDLSGTIPPEIRNLSALKNLSLVGDEGGIILHPPVTGQIPIELASLPNLEHLSLINNIFDQESVGILFTMTKLKSLAYTPLSPLTEGLGNLVNLEELSLHSYRGELARTGNNGSIPKSIGSLTKLKTLLIANAGFEGPIPTEIENLKNLYNLNISGLTNAGRIPAEIGNLTKLGIMSITGLTDAGPIPPEIGNLNLAYLDLSFNGHTGSIPASFNKMSSVATLNLDGNRLGGAIPDLSALRRLRMSLTYNSFNYDQLESITHLLTFYGSQRMLKLNKANDVLSVYAGGTLSRNTYTWYRNNKLVATIVGDSTYKVTEPGSYFVNIKNNIATNTTLRSVTLEAALPVTLISFEANATAKSNQLTWKTSSETNNQGFEIEKSRDARVFETIAFVDGNGDTRETKAYHFTDNNPYPITYYRLKQLDYDDGFEYSKIITVKNEQEISLYPNPASEYLLISGLRKDEDLIVVSQNGNVVLKQKTDQMKPVNISALTNGIYTIKIGDTAKNILIQK